MFDPIYQTSRTHHWIISEVETVEQLIKPSRGLEMLQEFFFIWKARVACCSELTRWLVYFYIIGISHDLFARISL